MCDEEKTAAIGEARAIVLLNEQGARFPVALRVRATPASKPCEFERSSVLSRDVRSHCRKVLVPLAKRMVAELGGSVKGWRLLAALPPAAQLHGEAIVVEGNSADLALCLAMVSAGLGEPLAAGLAVTGQISGGGDEVGLVRGLEHKLQLADPEITRVLVPAWADDAVFAKLYPDEYAAVRTAVKTTRRRVIAVRDAREAWQCARVPASPRAREELSEFHGPSTIQAKVIARHNVTEAERTMAREVVGQCSESLLVGTVDRPVEERWAMFRVGVVTPETAAELLKVVEQLVGHLEPGYGSPMTASIEAARLIKEAFVEEGAMTGALRRIRDGTEGGLRGVLNRIVARIITERREEVVRGVLTKMVDPADGDARLRLVRGLLAEYETLFPPEVELAPPEMLANDPARLVLAINSASNRIQRAFRQ